MNLNYYARHGNVVAMQALLDSGSDINAFGIARFSRPRSICDLWGQTPQSPLMCAVTSGYCGPDAVQFLIEHGADVNAQIPSITRDTVLELAARCASPAKIRLLLQHGANATRVNSFGSDVVLIACTRSCDDNEYIDILSLLLASGASPSTCTASGETGLGHAAVQGRFDAVHLLVSAGANIERLNWSPLHKAVAMGTLSDVRQCISQPKTMKRDINGMTPWLLSVLTGDIAKADVLRRHGADVADVDHRGEAAIMIATRNRKPEMLSWLLKEVDAAGASVPARGGYLPAEVAIANDDCECLNLLLDNGPTSRPRGHIASLAILTALLDHGVSVIEDDYCRLTTGIGDDDLCVSDLDYFSGREFRFGRSNPEEIENTCWTAMINSGASTLIARRLFNDNAKCRVWSLERTGKSHTELAPGRIVQIGGMHDDNRADFGFYNDVIVFDRGQATVYGYPSELFCPLAFHSATVVDGEIFVIGGQTEGGDFPEYAIDCETFQVRPLCTTGNRPVGIWGHSARFVPPRYVYVAGGRVGQGPGSEHTCEFRLDIESLRWSTHVGQSWHGGTQRW